MNKHKTTKINIRIEDEMHKLLVQIASDNDTSLSEVIRYLIKEGLNDHKVL